MPIKKPVFRFEEDEQKQKRTVHKGNAVNGEEKQGAEPEPASGSGKAKRAR